MSLKRPDHPDDYDDIEHTLACELGHKRHDPLPAQEVIQLVLRAQKGDIEARNRVIETHLRMASQQARHFMGRSISFLDLFQECFFALNSIINNYDPYFGGRTEPIPFSVVARIYIKRRLSSLICGELRHPGRIRNPDTSDRWTGHNDAEIEKVLLVQETKRSSLPKPNREKFMGIRDSIATLPELQQKIISLSFGLFDLCERDEGHIAHVLAMPEESVQEQRESALNAIRRYLEVAMVSATVRRINRLLTLPPMPAPQPEPQEPIRFNPAIFIPIEKASAPQIVKIPPRAKNGHLSTPREGRRVGAVRMGAVRMGDRVAF